MKYFAFLCVVFFTFSCGSEYEHNFSDKDLNTGVEKYKSRPVILKKGKITISEIDDIPPFDDVTLELVYKNSKFGQGDNKLEFDIKKFVLGDRTVAESETGLLKEAGGQYMEVVGEKAEKHFSQHVEKDFVKGDNHVLAFLNRSYGISIKSAKSYTFHTINTDNYGGKVTPNKTDAFLYLSKPQKETMYTESDAVLLDFFLVNFKIAENGNYLKLKIDETSFELTKWCAYKIDGLGFGKHEVSLKAFDKNGKELSGKLLNTVRASFEIAEGLVFE